jgi:hypothetical protein
MGIEQTIKVMLIQKEMAMLTEAIRDTMKLELINETNDTAKNKIASLADMDNRDLKEIADELDEPTIKMINHQRQPFKHGNQFPTEMETGPTAKATAATDSPSSNVATATRKVICN